jgi:hypothetical protein
VAIQARAGDYKSDIGGPTVAGERAPAAHASDFLPLLARAVQQYHTYPSTSPLCRSAVEACQRSLQQLRREHLTFRVAPKELIVDEVPFGAGTLVELELARRLHAAGVAQVTIEQAVSIRELAHFAMDLIACSQRERAAVGLIEMLGEHGVDRVVLRAAYRPEVLPVAAPPAPLAGLLATERERREQNFAAGGHIDHLYPPDKGWVRVDPSVALPSVSLVDLALLAEDPAALAGMLVRLTDNDAIDEGDRAEALSQKFSDVSTLFSALDPRLARVMFAKLARAVLDLDTDRRQALLRRTILPSLLDGRIDGTVLRDFPDVDLAESLCLLLDLETAAPEVVTTALAKLNLSAERETAIMPLIEQRLQGHAGTGSQDLGLDAHARRLVRINHEKGRSFAEFSAFDLSLDADAQQTLVRIQQDILASDVVSDQLSCLWHLTWLEPNPEVVQKFMARSEPLLGVLQAQQRWSEVADWLARHREHSASCREARPDVSDVIHTRLTALCTPELGRKIVELADRDDEGRAVAGRLVEALGEGIGPALLEVMQRRPDARDQRPRGAVQILCDHARLVAPALAAAIGRTDDATERLIARVLGLAGPGYEAALGTQLASRDEQTVREVLRSLARIGTPQAAALVSTQVHTRKDWVAAAAEQTLWHLPPAEAQREVRGLLVRPHFASDHPEVAARLVDRLAQTSTAGLEEALRAMAGFRYRFWKPAQMRLGRKAQALLRR